MESISSLHLLAEAVRSAGADIAPTYQEYIQLAFAIANDCGEAGRPDFLALCSPSPKYDPQAADKLFSNALKTGRNDVHIGSVFHLAELCGVKVHPETPPAIGTLGTQGSPGSSSSHTRVPCARQRSAGAPAHFRRTHPLAPSAGVHRKMRYLPCSIRRASAGGHHRAGCRYGTACAKFLWRKNDVALPANLCGGTARIGQGCAVAGAPAGRTHTR